MGEIPNGTKIYLCVMSGELLLLLSYSRYKPDYFYGVERNTEHIAPKNHRQHGLSRR